jgi:hypothetical protein
LFEGLVLRREFAAGLAWQQVPGKRVTSHESPSQRKANLRTLQDRPPSWRDLCRLHQPASQAAPGLMAAGLN